MSSIANVNPAMPQSVLQELLDSVGTYGVLELDPGEYHLNRPLFVPSGVTVQGRYGPENTKLICDLPNVFPAIVRIPSTRLTVPTQGDALVLNGTSLYWVNVSADCQAGCDLSGITPWSCSLEYTPDTLAEEERSLIQCQGMKGTDVSTSWRQAFGITTYENQLRFYWNWDGNRHQQIATNALVVGEPCDILLTFDGTNMTGSINGIQVVTEPAGPIQMSFHEDITIGCGPWRWPDGASGSNMTSGTVRNVHITGSSPYPVPADIHPRFENCDGPMIPIDANGRTYWTPFRNINGADFASIYVKNLSLVGGGVYLDGAVDTLIDNVTVSQSQYGFYLYDNCYKAVLQNVRVLGGRIACFLGNQSNLCLVDKFQFQDAVVGLLCSGGGGVASNGFIYNYQRGCAVMLKGDWPSLTLLGVAYGDESMPVAMDSGIYASHARGLTIIGGGGTHLVYPVPLVTLEDSPGTTIQGMLFGLMPTTPGLIEVLSGELPTVVGNPPRVGAGNTDVSGIPLIVPNPIPA